MTSDEWAAKWPRYCTKCGGWGGHSYYEMHGFRGGGGELILEPCDAHDDCRTCCRCGEPGLSECGEGPCSLCGWNFDDGIPDQYEQSELYEDHEKETLEISVGILPDMPDGAGKAQLGLDGRNEAKAEGEG